MKSGVKTDFARSESQSVFIAFDFAGRPVEVARLARRGPLAFWRCRFGGRFGGFTRPCASVNALRHTWGTRGLCFPVQGHRGVVGLGDQPATGTRVATIQAERWGLTQPPGSAPPPGRRRPAAFPPLQSHMTFAVGCGSWPRKRLGSNSPPVRQSVQRVRSSLRCVLRRAWTELPVRVSDCW